jgi:hypothetical protein
MDNTVLFKPRHALDSESNLNEFIRFCREDLAVYGNDLDWNSNYWKVAGASFGEFGTRAYSGKLPSSLMQQPYLDFAKAYFRYISGVNPNKGNLQVLTALKAIELGLRRMSGASDLNNLNNTVLDHVLDIVSSRFCKPTAYHVGRNVKHIVGFLNDKHLIPSHIEWSSPLKQPYTHVRTGRKAEERRQKRMPDNELLNIIGHIFSKDLTYARDIITTSVIAVLMGAPSRISEVLSLQEDCEVWEKDKNGNIVYGLRFWPAKGGLPEIKQIPDIFAPVVELAIARVRKITAPAREMARWYESKPNLVYPHPGVPYVGLDDKLDIRQSAAIFGFEEYPTLAGVFINLGFYAEDRTLRKFGEYAEKHLPKNFPWFDEERKVKYSEALFCMQHHLLHNRFHASPIRIENAIARQRFNQDLSENHNLVARNIFDRHGFIIDESRTELRAHAIRHLINTMGQRGGLSQYDIARWSGRKDIQQNRDYDHMSEFELIGLLKDLDNGSLSLFGPIAEIAQKLPVSTQEFNALVIPTAHVTEYGFCIHDFTMEPCQKYRDCLNCSEQVCIKGDNLRLGRLKDRFESVERLVASAEQEIKDGSYGADRHYEILKLTHVRLSELIKILENPMIKNGAIVKLRNENEFSPLKLSLQKRIEQAASDSSEQDMINDLADMMGF